MPKKTKQSNKKQRDAVQNLLADNYTKAPQAVESKKTRAKFSCNPKLEEMVRLANLLPKDFYFDLIEAIKEGKLPSLYWFEKSRNFSSELLLELDKCNEDIEYETQDNGIDWRDSIRDFLFHLTTVGKLHTNELNQLIYGEERMLVKFLFDRDYFDDFELWKQKKQQRNVIRDYVQPDCVNDESQNSSSDFFSSKNFVYMKALERLLKIKELLFGLVKLAEIYNLTPSESRGVEKVIDENTSPKKVNFESKDFIRVAYDNYFKNYGYGIETAIERAAIVEEIVEYIQSGQFATLGLSDEEAGRFIYYYSKFEAIKNKLLISSVLVSKDGVVNFLISEWAEAIQGVNISRLRKCDICEKFFWASRKDTFACSKKHSKVRQMRLLRENWKDKGDLYLKARQKKTNKKKEK
ncbi:hypothetical protein BH18ACI1_BH18ACI1_17940 [soil metagenome]